MMKNLLLLMLVAFSMLLTQCKIVESVFGDKVKFELESVQPYFATFNISNPADLQVKAELTLLGKDGYTYEINDVRTHCEIPFSAKNREWEVRFFTFNPPSKKWTERNKTKLANLFPAANFRRVNPYIIGDTVSIGVDLLPNLTAINCNNLGTNNWSSITPVRDFVQNGGNIPSTVIWHFDMQGPQTVNRYYYVRIALGSDNTGGLPVRYAGTIIKIGSDGQCYIMDPRGAACTSPAVPIVPTNNNTWAIDLSALSSGASAMITAEAITSGPYQLHITTPQGASVTVERCSNCLN